MKLIRDKIKITDAETFVPDEPLGLALLHLKLEEELSELKESNFSDIEEYADVIEVLIALAGRRGIPENELFATRHKKLIEKGGFSSFLVLKDDLSKY